jgi:hypothetical protein
MTRRSFAVLLAAGMTGTALAGPAPALEGRYEVTQAADGTLSVRLWLTNRSTEALSVLRMLGTKPGPSLVVQAEGTQLLPIRSEELATRAGPRPVFVTLAAGGELEVGPWRFHPPQEVPKRVTVSGVVRLDAREPVTLPEQTVTVGSS